MKKTIYGILLITICVLICGCKDVKLENGEEAVITFEEGGISAQEFYDTLKKESAKNILADTIDTYILNKLYEDDKELKNYVNNAVKNAKNQASKYNMNLVQFLNAYYGKSSVDTFKDYLALEYKRSLWIDEYAEETVTDTQIEDYYEDEVVGDMDLSHILITPKSTESDDKKEAKNIAEEVIEKLNNGEDFADLALEYSEDEDTKDNGGNIGFINVGDFNDTLIEAAKDLEVGSYSKNPIETENGYEIIFKKDQKEKPELDEELRKEIITKVAKEISQESAFYSKALLELRSRNKLEFTDTNLESLYNEYLEDNGIA